MLSNKKGASPTQIVMGLLFAVVFIAALGVGFYVYNTSQQTALVETQTATGVPSGLDGKSATVSSRAYDKAANSITQVVAPLYLLKGNIQQSTNSITGDTFAADGTSMSSTAVTDTTSGLIVGTDIIGIASNNTWYGIPGVKTKINGQSMDYNLDVYKVAAAGGKITVYDKDDDPITTSVTNLSMGVSQSYSLSKLKIENNVTQTAWNVAGIYLSETTGDNVTSYSMSGAISGSATGTVSKDTSKYSLLSRSNVDSVFVFDKPILLLQWDSIYTPSLTLEADGDGCSAGEAMATMKVFDANWFRSSKTQAMLFGAETDADSPSDVGAADLTVSTIYCGA